MKKIITICSLLLIVTTSLFSNKKSEWEEGVCRSITITMDEDTLYIHSDKQYENLDIQIQGIDGTVIYTNSVGIQEGTRLTVPFSKLTERTDQTVLIVNDRTLGIIPVK